MALEAEGWLVKFEQKCKHCGTINSFCRRMSMVKCKKCKKDYRMDDPNHHVIVNFHHYSQPIFGDLNAHNVS